MDIWLTSDGHFDHRNIIDFCDRPFRDEEYGFPYAPDVDKMNEFLIEAWNETVQPGDTVIYVGDLSMRFTDRIADMVRRLNGDIILVAGNHDDCFRFGKTKQGRQHDHKYHAAGIKSIHSEMMFEGYRINHFPYDVDFRRADGADRFAACRPERDGTPLIHGHVHNNDWDKESNHRLKGNDQINVGVDAWGYKPVNFDTIKELL